MVNDILSGAGFIENKTYKECRFVKPPSVTFAVFSDSISRHGADNLNLITLHDVTVELYAYAPDRQAEERIEQQFEERGIPYEKIPRYWIESEQLYQTIYEFSYDEK